MFRGLEADILLGVLEVLGSPTVSGHVFCSVFLGCEAGRMSRPSRAGYPKSGQLGEAQTA